MDKRNRAEETLITINTWANANKYKLMGGHYINESSLMRWKCLACNGEEFDETWRYMRKDGIIRCKCRPSRKQINMFSKIVEWSKEKEVLLLSDRYVHHDSILMWKCLRCNSEIKNNWNEISRDRTTICSCRKPESKEVTKLRELNRTSGCALITPFKDYTDLQQDLMWDCLLLAKAFENLSPKSLTAMLTVSSGSKKFKGTGTDLLISWNSFNISAVELTSKTSILMSKLGYLSLSMRAFIVIYLC